MNEKEQLIEIFEKNIRGKKPDISKSNQRHDGKYGHWLERQFGITSNRENQADILGYELKNQTSSKTTFGDWSPNYFIYKDKDYSHIFTGKTFAEKQNQFVRLFGKSNIKKKGRYSWSGQAAPKLGHYNDFGQIMKIEDNSDITIYYNYQKDKRANKSVLINNNLRNSKVIIARWYSYAKENSDNKKSKLLKNKVEDKFNQKGWFTCKMNSEGFYDKIYFGRPLTFERWLDLVKQRTIFFDPGMYEGNSRPYCQWRANNKLWEDLLEK